MKGIGGFLELELPNPSKSFHKNAISFSTGRACLNFILQQVKPKMIYIPYYTCDAVIEPIQINNIKFKYYSLNNNLRPDEIILNDNEYKKFKITMNKISMELNFVYISFGLNIIVAIFFVFYIIYKK